jgi:hypothetical protein
MQSECAVDMLSCYNFSIGAWRTVEGNMTDWIGRTLSKVEIRSLIGVGGMAEVYLGHHTTLNQPVAVKILHGYLTQDELFLNEFQHRALGQNPACHI